MFLKYFLTFHDENIIGWFTDFITAVAVTLMGHLNLWDTETES